MGRRVRCIFSKDKMRVLFALTTLYSLVAADETSDNADEWSDMASQGTAFNVGEDGEFQGMDEDGNVVGADDSKWADIFNSVGAKTDFENVVDYYLAIANAIGCTGLISQCPDIGKVLRVAHWKNIEMIKKDTCAETKLVCPSAKNVKKCFCRRTTKTHEVPDPDNEGEVLLVSKACRVDTDAMEDDSLGLEYVTDGGQCMDRMERCSMRFTQADEKCRGISCHLNATKTKCEFMAGICKRAKLDEDDESDTYNQMICRDNGEKNKWRSIITEHHDKNQKQLCCKQCYLKRKHRLHNGSCVNGYQSVSTLNCRGHKNGSGTIYQVLTYSLEDINNSWKCMAFNKMKLCCLKGGSNRFFQKPGDDSGRTYLAGKDGKNIPLLTEFGYEEVTDHDALVQPPQWKN